MTLTMQLQSPLTAEDWAKITDENLEHTERITFTTPSGRSVPFVKERIARRKTYYHGCNNFSYNCEHCGASIGFGDYYCWGCGARLVTDEEAQP